MKRFWVRWYEPVDENEDPRPLTWPLPPEIRYWVTGWLGDGSEATLCALVHAESEAAAKAAIVLHWRPREFSFCDEKPADWLPPADRFPG